MRNRKLQIARSLQPETVPQELHDLLRVGCPRRDKEIIGVLDIGVCIGPGARHKAALGHIQRNGSRFTVRVRVEKKLIREGFPRVRREKRFEVFHGERLFVLLQHLEAGPEKILLVHHTVGGLLAVSGVGVLAVLAPQINIEGVVKHDALLAGEGLGVGVVFLDAFRREEVVLVVGEKALQ